jgi:hypothetical protein
MPKKLKIKAIYDNGGETLDQYTVYYNTRYRQLYDCRGMSKHPCSPQGFGQCSSGKLGRHNGKRINFEDLPEDCQKLVNRDLG